MPFLLPEFGQYLGSEAPYAPFCDLDWNTAVAEDRGKMIGPELIAELAHPLQASLGGPEDMRGHDVFGHYPRVQLPERFPYLAVVLVALDAAMVAPRNSIVAVRHFPMASDILASARASSSVSATITRAATTGGTGSRPVS